MAEKLVVVGQGPAGLPLATRAAEAGFRVVGLDEDEWRVKRLNAGEPCVEGVGAGELAAAHASGRYTASADAADASGFDFCVLTVAVRMRDGAPDLGPLGTAAGRVAPFVRPGATVVVETAAYPGTTEEFVGPILERGSGLRTGEDFHLGHSPRRAEPGDPRWRIGNTPKVVSGVGPASLRAVTYLYGRLVRETVPVSSPRVAELCALLEGARAHLDAALANELAIFAGQLGVDVWEAAEAAAGTPYGRPGARPGPGLPDSCLPVDVSYVPWAVRHRAGRGFRLIEAANDVNANMPAYVVDRIGLALNRRCRAVRGSRILLLGLTPVEVAKSLCRLGARVRAADPRAADSRAGDLLVPAGVEVVEPDAAELARADVVVVLGAPDCYDYDLVQRASRFVFDTRGRCRGPNVERL
ncbi:nucleotide sugar dehydrogenase [Microbispora triticiradicis]|uniref:Nucleotide sugar dehydrogenase n=2 Tax=Microbispora TaxID=2005 RepID=A0ABY3LW58_9ACTN|nr:MULTISPECIES: nucleotide sugar dehydrogenase [Microbispora]TLP63845.1 nucleotide sugar dehydrogenase [Microbispora fusca]TYB57515.1 nucleotide sugar dehydrogenase [Microbispora tritici]